MAIYPHTKEEMALVSKFAAGLYSLLKDGEAIQIMLPLSKIVATNGERPVGVLIICKPTLAAIVQAQGVMPPQPVFKPGDNGGKKEVPFTPPEIIKPLEGDVK